MPKRPLSKQQRLEKIEQLLLQSSHGLRVVHIAEVCGVDRRTVYRDLRAMQAAGIPLSQHEGRYQIVRERHQTTLRLSFDEMMQLFLAVRMYACYANVRQPHLIALLNQLSTASVEPLSANLRRMAEYIARLPADVPYVDQLSVALQAWVKHKQLRVWLDQDGRGQEKIVDLALYVLEPSRQGTVFLVGQNTATGEACMVDLQQVNRLKTLEQAATFTEQFDPSPYLTLPVQEFVDG